MHNPELFALSAFGLFLGLMASFISLIYGIVVYFKRRDYKTAFKPLVISLAIMLASSGGLFLFKETPSRASDKARSTSGAWSGRHISGTWSAQEIQTRNKFIQVLAVSNNKNIRREDVNGALLAVLGEVQKRYEDWRVWIFLVPDGRMIYGTAAGLLRADGANIEIYNGRPPEEAYSEEKWIQVGLKKLEGQELEDAIVADAIGWEASGNGLDGDATAAKQMGISKKRAAELRDALNYEYSPFTW